MDDVPTLSGPLMPVRAFIIMRPDLYILAKAFSAANWKWVTAHATNSPLKTFEQYMEGSIPSIERITKNVIKSMDDLSPKPGDYIQGGGIIIFRSKSGRYGMCLEWVLGEHYKRIKEEGYPDKDCQLA